MITAFIADDEPLALAKLKLFLERTGRVQICGEFGDGASLLAALLRAADEGQSPDLLVVDVQMPALTGMEVIERLPRRPLIIITTAFEQYALPSFAEGVTDYLLKPYSQQRLEQAVHRAAEALRLAELDRRQQETVLTVRSEGRTERLPADAIVCLTAEGDYTRITTDDGHRRLVLEPLTALAARLPAEAFVRTHRSHLVAVAHIRSIGARDVRLTGGLDIPIGKTYREQMAQIEKKFSTKG